MSDVDGILGFKKAAAAVNDQGVTEKSAAVGLRSDLRALCDEEEHWVKLEPDPAIGFKNGENYQYCEAHDFWKIGLGKDGRGEDKRKALMEVSSSSYQSKGQPPDRTILDVRF